VREKEKWAGTSKRLLDSKEQCSFALCTNDIFVLTPCSLPQYAATLGSVAADMGARMPQLCPVLTVMFFPQVREEGRRLVANGMQSFSYVRLELFSTSL